MTKKHFVAMARKFNALLAACADSPECVAGIILSVHAFCDISADANARFDRARFVEAAGCNDYAGNAVDCACLASGMVGADTPQG